MIQPVVSHAKKIVIVMAVLIAGVMGASSTLAQSSLNLLRGGPTSFLAVPIEINGTGGATPYLSNLADWVGKWKAPQALYDRGTYVNSEDYWDLGTDVANKNDEGSTWNEGGSGGNGIGILVVDLQTAQTINRFSVFQVFSDGKVSHIQFFMHSNTSATAPAFNDAGWVAVAAESVVGPGLEDIANNRIGDPTKIAVPAFTTRYLKIAVKNDGRYGQPNYIEVKGVKAFGPTPAAVGGVAEMIAVPTASSGLSYLAGMAGLVMLLGAGWLGLQRIGN